MYLLSAIGMISPSEICSGPLLQRLWIQGYLVQTIPVSAVLDTDIRFQLTANNDNETWDFVGPDGTDSTYRIPFFRRKL